MGPNEGLEDPTEDYVPALDEMVHAMQVSQRRGVAMDHDEMDQMIRDAQPMPEKRHCFRCGRWVSLGLGDPEGEDPRCDRCNWQRCICNACGCDYGGMARSEP